MKRKLFLFCFSKSSVLSQFTRRNFFFTFQKREQTTFLMILYTFLHFISSKGERKKTFSLSFSIFFSISCLQHKFIKSFLVSSYYVHSELFMIFFSFRPTKKVLKQFFSAPAFCCCCCCILVEHLSRCKKRKTKLKIYIFPFFMF